MHSLSLGSRRNKSLHSLQEINPIMADLLIKKAVAPEQLGLQKDDVRKLENHNFAANNLHRSSRSYKDDGSFGGQTSSLSHLHPLATHVNSSSNGCPSLSPSYSFSVPLVPDNWASSHELLANDNNIEIPFTIEKWYLSLIRFMLIALIAGYLATRACLLRKYDVQRVQYTIRVNTFRRNDLLATFLEHYVTCPSDELDRIHVVWSDVENKPPKEIFQKYEDDDRVHFEIHSTNSLSNRFKLLDQSSLRTEAVLSIDDDLIIPCSTLQQAARVWNSNKFSAVGFAPRLGGYEESDKVYKYNGWKKTWLTGMYTIVLTKVCFFDKQFLQTYVQQVPKDMLTFIDQNRNCEDLAMSHTIAAVSKAPPVWVEGIVYEKADEGISSGSEHFDIRGSCLEKLRHISGFWPWPTGYQKAVKVGSTNDLYKLLLDRWKV